MGKKVVDQELIKCDDDDDVFIRYITFGWGVVGSGVSGIKRKALEFGIELEQEPKFLSFNVQHTIKFTARGKRLPEFMEYMNRTYEPLLDKAKRITKGTETIVQKIGKIINGTSSKYNS